MGLIIGILGRPKKDEREFISFSKAVSDVIISYGYIALGIIPPVIDVDKEMDKKEISKLHQLIDLCDGIILQGGSDYYQYDIEAIKYIAEKNIPLLGICLGMQSMGATYGASLVSVSNHHHQGIDYVHAISIDSDSNLYKIMGVNNIMVNSRHNEMIIKPMNIKIVGTSNQVIEAIENDNLSFFIGVQWHPEDMVKYDKYSRKLFESFFLACEKSRKKEL